MHLQMFFWRLVKPITIACHHFISICMFCRTLSPGTRRLWPAPSPPLRSHAQTSRYSAADNHYNTYTIKTILHCTLRPHLGWADVHVCQQEAAPRPRLQVVCVGAVAGGGVEAAAAAPARARVGVGGQHVHLHHTRGSEGLGRRSTRCPL